MSRGFVTIATGRERFYIIAVNLLKSYRHYSADPLPFAIICDVENEYTQLFDDVVIMDNPRRSYLDKLALPRLAPYDETIFIDSDNLAYRDLNDFWSFFENAADFTAFGLTYPTDYRYAWFKVDDVGEYAEKIKFIPDFVGGVYFIRKTKELEAFANTCDHVLENYYRYTFRQFKDPADEPVIALAMAVHGFEPVDREQAPICFYPLATSFSSDFSRGQVSYKNKYEDAVHSWAYLVHWGSGNTPLPPYIYEVARLQKAVGERSSVSTACKLMGMKAFFCGKRCAKAILSKLHLLGYVQSVHKKLKKGDNAKQHFSRK